MERSDTVENHENEYMAMDPDQWEDQDDTYENGDTLGIDIGRRDAVAVPGGATQPANTATFQTNPPPRLALPSRYTTLRWPLPNGNKEPGKTGQSGLFKKTTVGLVLVCILLLGVLVGLSIAYDILAGIHLKVNEQKIMLQDENQKLQKEIDMNSWRRTRYRISSIENLSSAEDVYVLNLEVLELE